jgi:hypothetical protein
MQTESRSFNKDKSVPFKTSRGTLVVSCPRREQETAEAGAERQEKFEKKGDGEQA